MPADGQRRDCVCPHARHKHGTIGAYVNDNCRCNQCRAPHAAGSRRRRRQIAYGTWQPVNISNIGSRRRVQALACNGWSIPAIANRMGCKAKAIDRLFQADCHLISREKADRIRAVYDELWNQHAPQRTKGEKISARRVSNMARQRGYSPPLAWNDEELDDPAAVPHVRPGCAEPVVDEVAVGEALAGRPVPLTRAERAEVVRVATEQRMSAERIGELIGCTPRTVVRYRAGTAA